RPLLVLLAHEACGGGGADPWVAACAVEMVHVYSLIHDDLPAMDDDDLRRGRPTNHKVFGEAMAILAGDGLFALAFHILSQNADPAVAPELTLELARASGYVGMIGGQVLDMEGENQRLSLEQLRHLHRMKTGALLVASCRMGAIASGAGTEGLTIDAVTTYGRHLGLAFQIVDDILDVTSTPEQLGKGTGKDAGRGKNTYPAILGLEESRVEAMRQLEAAVGALTALGERAEGLQKLASFVVERQA
ncbi:MAG TPA: farnesyl diphosphate synthase, partial [Tepidisphaeraceae bacterium]|nr:farnesyl diphosphate synthase [Tepidisphaeraceae bacterium]